MKKFDIEKAKAGAKVCTLLGRDARIICFDKNSVVGNQIVALVKCSDGTEQTYYYSLDGSPLCHTVGADLMMVTEHHEGWINLCKIPDGTYIIGDLYTSEKEAVEASGKNMYNVATVRIEWEEQQKNKQ